MKEKFEAIISKVLPKFWSNITLRKYSLGGSEYLAIKIAACDILINGVEGQRVQAVSLCFDIPTMELYTQSYNCSGGGSIYRDVDKSNPKEQYLAMKNEKVPFRRPLRNEKAVLKAFESFCVNYKETLIKHRAVLRYQNMVINK
jgi:hypothetical protein